MLRDEVQKVEVLGIELLKLGVLHLIGYGAELLLCSFVLSNKGGLELK